MIWTGKAKGPSLLEVGTAGRHRKNRIRKLAKASKNTKKKKPRLHGACGWKMGEKLGCSKFTKNIWVDGV